MSDPTDNYSDWRTRPLPEGTAWSMRVGRKIPRNLYIQWPDGRSEPVGQVDTAAIAALVCDAVNALRLWPGDGVIFRNHFGGDVGPHVQGHTINNLTISGDSDGI